MFKRKIRKTLRFWINLTTLIVILVPWQVMFYLNPRVVNSASTTLTSRVDFDLGYYNNVEAESKEGEIKIKPDGTWGPRAFKTPNVTLSDQAAIISDGNYVYLIASSDKYFARYLPAENRWQTLADAPHYAYPGASMAVIGNYIYAIFGGYQKEYARYSISTNTWENLVDLPDLIYGGSSLATDGTYIYAIRGTATSDFWRYDPSTDSWATKASTPATMYTGASLVHYSGNLYATRGYSTTTIYRYNISTDTWFTTTTGGAALTTVPASLNEDGNISIKNDEIFIARGINTNTFYKYNITSNSWSTLTTTPQTTRYVGTVYNAVDDYVYVFRGNSTYDFWKYNPTTNAYLGPADLPNTPGSGADLVYYNGYLYLARGNNSQNFYRYNLSTNAWDSALANTPVAFNNDTKGVAAGSYLYFFNGSNNSFHRYDPSGATWTTLTATAPGTPGYGGTLVYPGSGDYIYATRGSLTRTFWRYTISTDTWSDPAVADLPDDAEAGYGSRLTSDGTDIYYIGGNGISKILKYTIGSNTWAVLNDLPFSPYWGTDCSYYSGKIFCQAGFYKDDFWEYSIAGNSWRKLPDLQSSLAYDIGPYNGGSLEIIPTSGVAYSISGQSLIWMHSFTPSSYNYSVSGTWTSDSIDLGYVTAWSSLSSETSTPSDSSITIETRTSSDRLNWSSWTALSGGTIQSTTARYIQVRATLNASSDRSQTPTVYSLTINYTGDTNAPNNPTTFIGKSQQVGGTDITSGSSYTYHQPYFTWSGATDSETNVVGYYLYFGTNASADPTVSGNYQTTTNYTATLEMTTGTTYYLRLKTKDSAGNISSAITGFTYVYSGVSPPQIITQTTTVDFSNGTATNISTSGDEIKLNSKSGFWQQERLSLAPASIYDGARFAYVSSSGKFYTFRGSNTNTFYEYDIATDTWSTKSTAPAAVYWGGGVVEGPSGYLYGWQGNNSLSFWRYNIAANTWDDAAASNPPQQLSYGADMIFDGNHYIYVLKGNSDDTFMRYDTDSDTWDTLANTDFGAPTIQTNNMVYAGGDLAYDDSSTIYAIQGNTRSGFASYNIQSNSWSQLPNLPALAYNGANIIYDAATNAIYYLSGWDKPFFYKYDITNQVWSSLQDAPAAIGWGGTMRDVGGNIYVLRGASTQTFYKYNIAKSSWLIPNVGLYGGWFRGTEYRTYGYGADIVKGDGNYFYLTRGNFDNLFVRYNSVTGEATKMADAPAGFYIGAELVYDSTNNKIYATASLYFRKFYVYDIATDLWSELTQDPPPTDVGEGSSMAYDGSRYIYWIRGGNTVTFYRFDTQGVSGSKWGSAQANTPGTMQYGADLVIKNDYLYALRGNNQISFFRYGPLSGSPSWSDPAVADLPTGKTIYNDGFLVDSGGDYLYACRGGNSNECFRYSVSGNNWTAISNAPAQITQGGSAASNGADKIYVIAGPGTNTFSNGLYTYVMQTTSSSFEESGNYVSPSHDLTSTYKYANISVTYTSATNSNLTVYTSSSANNSTWSDWSEASEVKNVGTTYTYKINSAANQYLKIKFILSSSDGIYSGKISDYTIYYYQDINAPTNPSVLSSYSSATQSASITTNTWYNHTAPNFDWPDAEAVGGATDSTGGSGIAGYYVYFGTDQDAQASQSGTLTTSSSYTASGLTSGNTYYLRIQSVDDDGNFSATNWQPFIYKFDSDPPTNPVTISVDPPGYTSINDYDFTLKGATDSASLISSYCYKYKTAEDEYSAESCISTIDANGTATASGILAYDDGENNTFYVRSKDNAGNYAGTYATQIYKYSGTAPSKPTNLEVTYPADGSNSNTVNEFAFAWDAPESFSGAQSGLKYYYSINALPTGNNVNEIGLTNTYLTSDSYATQKGDNVLYVVAKDEAGNIDYLNYAKVTFTADTSAPGIPRNIDISDVSIKETSSWRLALSWDAPESSGSGVSTYKIYRSAVASSVCTSNYSDFNYVASSTQTSYVDTGLTQDKKYYCVKACDSTNECSAVSDTVNLYPDGRWRVAPSLVGEPTATVKTKTATIGWSTSRTASSFVKYGKSSGSYGEEVGSSTQITAHSIALSGLDPGTTYYYKVLWTDEDGNTGSSDEYTFVTNAAPYVSSVKFSNVNINSAFVNFTIKSSVKATIEYGKTVSYGATSSLSTSTNESTYTVLLDSLIEGTPYHLRIAGEDEEGNIYYSDDYTFETLPTPKILNLKLQQVSGMATATLRLVWSSNTLISSIVSYYPTANPERAIDSINLALKKNHEVILKNLNDDTEYTLIIKGKDSAGNESQTETRKTKTSNDMRAPEIQNMNVEATIVGVGDSAKAQIVVSWDTDEPASTQVEYAQGTGTSYDQTTQEDSNLTTNHTVTITGLTAAKIYHLRASSKDKAGNIGQSFDTVIITPKSTKDALTLVIENLSKTFGFLNNLNIKK